MNSFFRDILGKATFAKENGGQDYDKLKKTLDNVNKSLGKVDRIQRLVRREDGYYISSQWA